MTVRSVMNELTAGNVNVSGWFEGVRHVYPVRVYYEDTDAAGIVYHANYLRFAERARTEMMRCLGAKRRALIWNEGVAFAVRSANADFCLPARLDDPLTVETGVEEVGGASMRLTQSVLGSAAKSVPSVLLVRMSVRLACIDSSLRPARMPKAVRTALQELVRDH